MVTLLAKIIEGLSFRNPYTNQAKIPTKNNKSIGRDKLEASFVFHVL